MGDEDLARRLMAEAFGREEAADFPWDDPGTGLYADPDGRGFAAVAWEGEGRYSLAVARKAAGLPAPAGQAYLSHVATDRRHRGRGVAAGLLDRVLAEADRRGVAVEAAAVDQSRTPPHGLLRSRGFTEVATVRGVWGPVEGRVPCLACHHLPCECTGTLFRREPR